MAGICPCTFGNSVSAALANLKKAKQLNPDQERNTASAVMLSKRVIRRNEMFEQDPWAYLVSFRLESGSKLELKVPEALYAQLQEGCAGTLVWQDDELISFT